MLLQAEDCQLVLIDFQDRLMTAMPDREPVLANARRLAQLAGWLDIPVWGTAQVPDKLGPLDEELAACCRRVIPKSAFSALSVLDDVLRPQPGRAPASAGIQAARVRVGGPQNESAPGASGQGASARAIGGVAASPRKTLVLAGCEAHVCLLQTALDLLAHDWHAWIVTDACDSRSPRNRDAAWQRLAASGACLATTEMIGFEWLRDASHPRFRDWQRLIR